MQGGWGGEFYRIDMGDGVRNTCIASPGRLPCDGLRNSFRPYWKEWGLLFWSRLSSWVLGSAFVDSDFGHAPGLEGEGFFGSCRFQHIVAFQA